MYKPRRKSNERKKGIMSALSPTEGTKNSISTREYERQIQIDRITQYGKDSLSGFVQSNLHALNLLCTSMFFQKTCPEAQPLQHKLSPSPKRLE